MGLKDQCYTGIRKKMSVAINMGRIKREKEVSRSSRQKSAGRSWV
jgi:hypothetical protein